MQAVVAMLIITIVSGAGCGEDNGAAVGDQSATTSDGGTIEASAGAPTAEVKKYFDAYLSGDCVNAVEMFGWDIPPSDSDLKKEMLQWKQEMLKGCNEKHAMLESYEVIDEQTNGSSAIVVTHLKGIENGILLDENISIPVEKVNGEWKMGLWMTWPFRPDSKAKSSDSEAPPTIPPPILEP